MAIPHRHSGPPGTYFVSSRTWQGGRIFQREDACIIFVENLIKHRDEGKYFLHSFVLMPDHFHLMLTLAKDTALERAIQLVKGGSSHAVGAALGRARPVWQRGFTDHRIRDRSDYQAHMVYIAQNPVKEGLAGTPERYRWSSASGCWTMDEMPQRLKPCPYAGRGCSSEGLSG